MVQVPSRAEFSFGCTPVLAGNSYPTVSLWNLGFNDLDQPVYTKVDGSERSIVLGPSNFSTSGVIEYPLDPPIQFEDGNMLAWLQQETVVRMYSNL